MNFVFDLGNVLIGWDAQAAFPNLGTEAQIEAYLAKVDYAEWNLANDRGRSKDAAIAAANGDPHLISYFDNCAAANAPKIQGTWNIAKGLKDRGYQIFALTNWSNITWGAALLAHPEMTALFDDICVSGFEGAVKPELAFYKVLTQRNGLKPSDCFMIDDRVANIDAARSLGWQGHVFTNPENLKIALQDIGIKL